MELFVDGDPAQPVRYEIKRLLHLGYTGRNQAEVQKHVDEHRKMGSIVPDSVPNSFIKSNSLLSTGDLCEVVDRDSAGEAEFVLFLTGGGMYVGVGSDHTDRRLGTIENMEAKSKHMSPSFISTSVWRWDDVRDHWDDIDLRSWIDDDLRPYQDGKVSAMLTPQALLEETAKITGVAPAEGTVIFSGTIAALLDGSPFSNRFKAELYDPKLGRRIVCDYRIEVLSKNWRT